MVDLLNNLQHVYHKWENREKDISKDQLIGSTVTTGPMMSTIEISDGAVPAPARKRFPAFTPRPMSSYRNNFSTLNRTELCSSIGQFKSMPAIPQDVARGRIFGALGCTKCSPLTRKSLVDRVETIGLKNILWIHTQNRSAGYITSKFHYVAYILKTNANFAYPNVSKEVLNSERVNEAIEAATMQEIEDQSLGKVNYTKILVKQRKRATKILQDMQSNISTFLIKLTAYVLFKVLSRLLNSIVVHKSQLEVVKKVNKTTKPVIYLPLHRSHLDYILITFILYNHELRAPIVAAGDNLRIPIFGPLLRGLGAFFIKRKLDPKAGNKDVIYRAVLHTYIETCLMKGHSMEVFIEGGRSRSGKACLPKAGLLSVVVDAFKEGVLEDALIVPIAISYEKLLDNGFLSEQLGKPKTMESFTSAMRGIWNVMNSNYGTVRVDFSKPFSLKEFVRAAENFKNTVPRPLLNNPPSPNATIRRLPSSASLYGTDIVMEDQRLLIKGLAEHVLHDAVMSTALMSTNLVAFLLLNKHRKGAMLKSFVQDFNWLCEEIVRRGRNLGFAENSQEVVEHGIELLGDKLTHVQRSEEHPDLAFISPNTESPHVLELAYYSNVVISAFLGDSIIVTAMYNILGEKLELLNGCVRSLQISKRKLIDSALDLCSILQYEFILTPPCITLESYLEDVIEEFIVSEIFITETNNDVDEDEDHSKTAWANRYSRQLEEYDELDDYFVDTFYQVNMSEVNIQKLAFLRNVLAPFIDGYWHLGCCLKYLVTNEMEERRFISLVQNLSIDKVRAGIIEYPECIGAETLRNGLKLFESLKVIDSFTLNNIKIIFLSDNYDNEEQIIDVLAVLAKFKK